MSSTDYVASDKKKEENWNMVQIWKTVYNFPSETFSLLGIVIQATNAHVIRIMWQQSEWKIMLNYYNFCNEIVFSILPCVTLREKGKLLLELKQCCA